MKKSLGMLVWVFIAGVAVADIAIDLGNNDPIFRDPKYGGGLVDRALYDLVWSPVLPPTQPHPAYPNADTVPVPDLLNPVDIRLASYETQFGSGGTLPPSGGVIFTDADVGFSDINTGYLFVRIYDMDHMAVGDWGLQHLIDGPVLMEFNPIDIPSIYLVDGVLGGQIGEGSGVQIIPEPASIALLGMVCCGTGFVRRLFPAV